MKEGIIQAFKTTCIDCGGEVTSHVIDFTGENEIIVDFLETMEFKCKACGSITEFELDKQRGG